MRIESGIDDEKSSAMAHSRRFQGAITAAA
jgi:hypothetical protein